MMLASFELAFKAGNRLFYSREKLSSDERFVDELRSTLRFMFAVIYQRLKKVGASYIRRVKPA